MDKGQQARVMTRETPLKCQETFLHRGEEVVKHWNGDPERWSVSILGHNWKHPQKASSGRPSFEQELGSEASHPQHHHHQNLLLCRTSQPSCACQQLQSHFRMDWLLFRASTGAN